MKHTSLPWRARHCGENLRGPKGHWEILTDARDARDTCIVQCIYNEKVAEYLVALHNAAIAKAEGREENP